MLSDMAPDHDTTAPDTLPPPADWALAEGDVVDGFRIEERLHQGGMANLWRVTRVDGPREGEPPLLMKVPRIKRGEDPATIVGFEVECMIMPTLAGPHVPRVMARRDFSSHRPYIVMERIDGPSLKARFDKAPLPLDEVLELGSRVAEALHDLHRQHVVHLDIKPSNVVQRPDGTAVLVDFGLSHHDHLPDLLDETFQLPMGTGPYISPEQVQYVRNDPRSDIFALGAMLYQFTTGQRPFGSPNTVRGLRKRLYTDAVPPRALRPDCPAWLQEIILKCLEVKPEDRFQTAAQLALALQVPDQVPLSDRAARRAPRGGLSRLTRWFRAVGHDTQEQPQVAVAAAMVHRNPVLVAAIDTEAAEPALLDAICEVVQRLMQGQAGARLACVSVMRTARIGMDERVDERGRSLHVKRLVHMKHWAQPIARELTLDEGRLTFHVLEAPDPAAAILDFARRSKADQVVMGASGSSQLRRYLGSVLSQVVAAAECTVTVVRAPAGAGEPAPPEAADTPDA